MNLKLSKIFSKKHLIIIAFFLVTITITITITSKFYGCNKANYKLINQQIVCTQKQTVDKKNYIEFKGVLRDLIEDKRQKGEISEVSLYFRDLKYGPTFGVDEYTQFSPASLLKLPMMITYLGLYENDPDIFETKLYYEAINQNDLKQGIAPKKTIEPNVHYRVADLIEYMIKYSDNRSYYVLLEYLNQISPKTQLLRDTFIDLGIIDPSNEFEDTITVKSYAGIFTQLYNSTYFTTKGVSEMALDFLSDTDFDQGIVAGVPLGTVVAHKFGERINESTGVKQLHDCGIVYFPENPYLICIMTRGGNMEDLIDTLSLISKMVYEEFDSRKLE